MEETDILYNNKTKKGRIKAMGDLIIIKIHTYPNSKLHTYYFTDWEKARSFIHSLKSNANVLDYRVSVTDANPVEEYCARLIDVPLKVIDKLDKKGFNAFASKRETTDGMIYEAFLEHPDLGMKRVIYLHQITVEELGLKSEEGLVDLIYCQLDYYIDLFRYEENLLPTYLVIEEKHGYVPKWPPMAD